MTAKSSLTSLIPHERIERSILLIRGHRVILDADLASLYEVLPKNLNRAVSRNRDRFPHDFMFQHTTEEFANLRFHFGTSRSWGGPSLPALRLYPGRRRDAVERAAQ